MLCGLIMAGGRGTRFWPLSTEDRPKQFLNLIGNDTMLQATVNRIKPIIPLERIFICTGEKYVGIVKEQLPELPERNIIVEPEGRNTAPCIALSALVIKRYYKNATMVVLPSDHLISDEKKFRDILVESQSFLASNEDAIVTLGMRPTRAETGYGYIKEGKLKNIKGSFEIVNVDRFVEKPNKELAEKYVKEGSYLWNGGMFAWKVEGVLNNIKAFLPTTYEALHQVEVVQEENLQKVINENYSKTEKTSVDYGILEKAKSIYVIPSDIGWDDVGSWEAIERYRARDEKGNIHIGNINSVDGYNNLVVASGQNIIIDNLSDIYVVENDGQIVIGKKDRVNKIKELKSMV